ncbi:MAG: DUF2191 domain-containing protein [Acidobacteriota bacterium]
MRTTLTLDDRLAAKLKGEARRSGKSFRQVVNEALRRGFALQEERRRQPPYRVQPRAMGVRPGLNYDRISELIEIAEGPLHR